MTLHAHQTKKVETANVFSTLPLKMNDICAANVQRLAAIVSVKVQAMLANHPFYRTLVRA